MVEKMEERRAVIGGLECDIKELRSMTREAVTLTEFAKLEVDSGDYKRARKTLEELFSLLREAHDKAARCLDLYRGEVLIIEDMLRDREEKNPYQ
ncbi:MAG: hypothetical protein OCU22_03675 [Canidatus Methanoxibalbensis ujae]|nr:hypothetical protein [Candidatus Methanoxibalbensis ujae]